MKAILFDLDGTLRESYPHSFDTLLDYLAELGHARTPEQAHHGERWAHYYWATSPELVEDFQEFGTENASFRLRQLERQLQALQLEVDHLPLARQIRQLYETRYQPRHHVPDDVRPTLQILRQRGYRLGLVSNRLEPLDVIVTELDFDGLFDFTLAAGQINIWKPEVGIFLHAAQLAECAPTEAMYVGDNYYADIHGARNAGLRPVLIDPKQLFPEAECEVIEKIGELKNLLTS